MLYVIYYYLNQSKKEFKKNFNTEHEAEQYKKSLELKGARFKIFRKVIGN